MMMMLCKMLRRKPRLPGASSSRHFTPTNLHIDRETMRAAHLFSTEALQSTTNEDGGKGILCALNSSSNPISDDVVDNKVEVTKALLRRYGFTESQLSKLYMHRRSLFNSDLHPDKTLMPKLDFCRGTIGLSNTDLPRFICSNPCLLSCSLQNQIVPVYNYIKGLLLSDDDDYEIVLKTLLRHNPRLLTYALEKKIFPNIAALRAAGVPHKQILYLLRNNPSASLGSSSLGVSIRRATEMGFHSSKSSFVVAIRMFTKMSKSTWDKKMEVYRKCGWSDEDILMAFRLNPNCMSLSVRKIEQTMDFFVNKMGCQPVYLARNPSLLNFSLEKRIIPRCTVVRYVQSKGLLPRKKFSLATFLAMKEKDFIEKIVKKYEIDAGPDLMDIYLGKIICPPELLL